MKYAITFILLLPMLFSGAGPVGLEIPACNCGEHMQDTAKLKRLIDRQVDSFTHNKLQALEQIKQEMIDSSSEGVTRIWLKHVDVDYRVDGRVYVWKWYYKVRNNDTIFQRTVVKRVK